MYVECNIGSRSYQIHIDICMCTNYTVCIRMWYDTLKLQYTLTIHSYIHAYIHTCIMYLYYVCSVCMNVRASLCSVCDVAMRCCDYTRWIALRIALHACVYVCVSVCMYLYPCVRVLVSVVLLPWSLSLSLCLSVCLSLIGWDDRPDLVRP